MKLEMEEPAALNYTAPLVNANLLADWLISR